MGHTVADARDMTIGEYDAMLSGWRRVHEDPDHVEPPTVEEWEEAQLRILANPALTGAKPS